MATVKTAEKAAAKVDEKRVIVSGSIPASLNEKFEDYRWENRLSKAEVVARAIDLLLSGK